jgi:hypothetical protein
LAFKIVNNEYVFMGMVDNNDPQPLFGQRLATASEVAVLKGVMATHALVFQVAELGESTRPRFRRIVGIHAVTTLTAEQLNVLFWETVGRLAEIDITVVAAVCDGAGCNRLWMKMQARMHNPVVLGPSRPSSLRRGPSTLALRGDVLFASCVGCAQKMGLDARGTPNEFRAGEYAWTWNRWKKNSKIWLISDSSHGVKKCTNNFEKSLSHGSTRDLRVPPFLVQMVLKHFPSPTSRADNFTGASVGEEWFIRVFGRLYFLLGSGRQTLYQTADSTVDSRIAELNAILKILRAWHDYIEHMGRRAGALAKETHSHFLSHQLYYDLQTMIEGFIGLVRDREARWGQAGVRARNVCQDSLESMFGRLRFACGSGQAVSMFKACHGLPREDERTQVLLRRTRTLAEPMSQVLSPFGRFAGASRTRVSGPGPTRVRAAAATACPTTTASRSTRTSTSSSPPPFATRPRRRASRSTGRHSNSARRTTRRTTRPRATGSRASSIGSRRPST